MPEPRTNTTAEELDYGTKTFLKKAQVVLEYESLREERDALIHRMERHTRFLVRLSWLGIVGALACGFMTLIID
jgi:hypothetical protein